MGNCVGRGLGRAEYSSQHGGDESPTSAARAPRATSGTQRYRPVTSGLVSNLDYHSGDFGWWSALFKPSGFVDYRSRLSNLPVAYRPVDGHYYAFREGSRLNAALRQAFLDLGPEALSSAGIRAVFEEGRHPERFSSLLALIQCGLFNARCPSMSFVQTGEGREKLSVNLSHRMAISGCEPESRAAGLTLKERFMALREAGESLNFTNQNGWTPLHCAVRFGNEATVAALLACKVKLNRRDRSGMTPLMLAVKHASPAIVAGLLDNTGADTNLRSMEGFAGALHFAVRRGGETGREMARMLIESGGADPGIEDGLRQTPLHLAVLARDEAMVRTLLDSRSACRTTLVNCRDDHGDTPLHVASRLAEEGIVHMLLQHGAHPNLANRQDRTVLDTAVGQGAPRSLTRLLEQRRAISNNTAR